MGDRVGSCTAVAVKPDTGTMMCADENPNSSIRKIEDLLEYKLKIGTSQPMNEDENPNSRILKIGDARGVDENPNSRNLKIGDARVNRKIEDQLEHKFRCLEPSRASTGKIGGKKKKISKELISEVLKKLKNRSEVDRLRAEYLKRLRPAEIESRKNLMYMCLSYTPWRDDEPYLQEWRVFNPEDLLSSNGTLFITTNAVTSWLSTNVSTALYPPGLLELRHCGCVVWKSRIYFVGGCSKDIIESIPSNVVYVFDTLQNEWVKPSDPHPPPSPMKQLTYRSIVMAYDDKIFAFGDYIDHTDVWAECYDLSTGEWTYLPPPPQELIRSWHPSTTHTVYENKKRLLFFVSTVGVFSYDIPSAEWISEIGLLIADPHGVTPSLFYQRNKVAVVGDLLFWHFTGSIYAYDLALHKEFTVFKFPNANQLFPPDRFPTRRFLARVGNNKLCLAWAEPSAWEDCRDKSLDELKIRTRLFHCHLFNICFEQVSGNPTLVRQASTSFDSPSDGIVSLLNL